MSFSIPTTALPKGLHVTRSRDGCPQITYRLPGIGRWVLLPFSAMFLPFWTLGCIAITRWALITLPEKQIPGLFLLLSAILFWAGGFYLLGFSLWFAWSFTAFTFHPDRLVVAHVFWGYSRRREYPKQAIHAVRQVKYKGEDPSWGLVIEGEVKGELLSGQPSDKSDWLGPVVATWAGVAFEPAAERN